MEVVAYVGLGANLGDRAAAIEAGLRRLGRLPQTRIEAVSRIRETDPVGYLEQPRFLNAVAALRTELDARTLLDGLLAIERGLGRTRGGPRFGPRTLDLDLLLYGGDTIDEPGLTVPHPRMHERRFVLEPLAEIEPALEIPGRGAVSALLAKLDG